MIEYNASEQTEIPEANGFSVKIVGVGGSGANVLDRMALEGSEAGDLLTINTDVRALSTSVSSNKIQLGKELLMGMGAGGDPELGRDAALEAEAEIRDAVRGYSMVFVCVGLGGGTGSGAAPEVCRIAREEGAFLVAFTSLPFGFEGKRRMQQATNALKGIGEYANAVVTFENDRMGELLVAKEGIQQAFAAADKLISQSILATTNMVTQPGIIRLGMDDLLTALRNRDSRCLFGFGLAKGDNRAQEALAQALKSPLIDKNYLMDSAENVLIHISGGDSLTLYEVEILMSELAKHVSDQAQILFGVGTDKKLGNSLAVTLISSVSSEKIGPPGGGRKKSEDKKKALKKDESANGAGDDGDGDDDGGGGSSAKKNEAGDGVEVKGAADGAPPPSEELNLDAGPGAELQADEGGDEPERASLEGEEKKEVDSSSEVPVEELVEEELDQPSDFTEENESPESGVSDDEESAEISSSATEQADDEISAEEAAKDEESELEEEAEETEKIVEEEEQADPEQETAESEVPIVEDDEDPISQSEDEDEADEPETDKEEDPESEQEGYSIDLAIEEFDAVASSDVEVSLEQEEPDLEAETAVGNAGVDAALDEIVEDEAVEDETETDDSVSVEQEIQETPPKIEVPSQGMASLLGLTPVDAGKASQQDDSLGEDEPVSEKVGDEETDEDSDEEASLSPFEIDDDDDEVVVLADVEGEQESVIDESGDEEEPVEPAEKASGVRMSIRDLAKKSLQAQQDGQGDDELIVHSLDEPEGDAASDDEDSIVSLDFEEDEVLDAGEDEAPLAKKEEEVVLSAAAGDGGDQEITLTRVESSDEDETEEEASEPEDLADKDEEEEVVDESDEDLNSAETGKASPQSQGVLELEPLAKGRFAKSEPTIVEGQDLDVPTFLRARRD